MEKIENIDLLMKTFADPVFFQTLRSMYNKKRKIKRKSKTKILNSKDSGNKRLIFNEGVECRKILERFSIKIFISENSYQASVDKYFKKLSADKYIKNCFDISNSSHERSECNFKQRKNNIHTSSNLPLKKNVFGYVSSDSDATVSSGNSQVQKKEEGKCNFSGEGQNKINSTLVTVSSDSSSEDEIALIQKSMNNKLKTISSKFCKEKNIVSSYVKRKSSPKVSKACDMTVNNSSKSNIMINPQKKVFTKRKGEKGSVGSDSEEASTNKIEVKFSNVNRAHATFAGKNWHWANSCRRKAFSASSLIKEDDVITIISSDSSTESDKDCLEKAKGKGTGTILKVQKSDCKNKNFKISRQQKSASVNKSSIISKALPGSSESKWMTNKLIGCNSEREVSKQNNCAKKIEGIHNFSIPNKVHKKYFLEACSIKSNRPLLFKRNSIENVENFQCVKTHLNRSVKGESKDNIFSNSKNKYYMKNCEEIPVRNKMRKKDIDKSLINTQTVGCKPNKRKKESVLTLTAITLRKEESKQNARKSITNTPTIKNDKSKQNTSKSITNTYTIGSKSANSSDILSIDSCNIDSNAASCDPDQTCSDADVLFEGVNKLVNNECKADENNTASHHREASLLTQKILSENCGKAHKFCNEIVCDVGNDTESLFSSVNNCLENDELKSNSRKDCKQIFTGSSFRNEAFNSDVIPSKPSELSALHNDFIKKKFDFIPEPVNFEIPLLHENESLGHSPKDKERWAKQGITVERKFWTPKEDEIIKKNYLEFSKDYGINDPVLIFGIYSNNKRDSSLCKFLKAKRFYLRLGKNLNDRTLYSIYNRARLLFHPHIAKNKWESGDVLKLIKLYNTFGTNWNKISQGLKRQPRHCQSYFYEAIKKKQFRTMLEAVA